MIILNDYGYQEQVYMAPRKPLYDVKISKKDKVLTIESDGSLLAKIGIEFDSATHMLQLIGKDNAFFDEVEMPVAFHSVSNIGYDKNNGEITITFLNTDGSFSDVVLDIDEVVKSYSAGDGIEITDENVINVKVKEGETHLASSEQGLEINLSDVTEAIASLSSETSGKQDKLIYYSENSEEKSASISLGDSDIKVLHSVVDGDQVHISSPHILLDGKLSGSENNYSRLGIDSDGDIYGIAIGETPDYPASRLIIGRDGNVNVYVIGKFLYNENEVATSEELSGKQDTLVSGENIKTINGESILGGGNIDISHDLDNYYTKQEVDVKDDDLNKGRDYKYYDDDAHKNIDRNLESGIYLHCNLGRPSEGHHGDEIYNVIVKTEYNIDNNLYYVQQWAYSENYPSREFYRIIKTPSLTNYDAQNYGEWVKIDSIVDAYTRDEMNALISQFEEIINEELSKKADKTDLDNYYTKQEVDEKILDPYEKELVLDASDKVAQTTQKVKEFLDRDGDITVIPSTIWDVNQGRTYEYYEGEEHRNIYNNLEPGVYKHCNLGRNMDGNHNDETYTVIVKAEFNINTQVYNVQQWAYSENYPSRAFYRIVKTPRLDYYEGDYGPWVQIDHLTDLQNYYRKDETFSKEEANQTLSQLYEEIVAQIPDITGLASEAYVRESINALAALVPTRDQVDEEMQLLSQNLTSYVDEKDMETLNESRGYTDDEIYRTETALNELARKFTRLTDGVKADDPTYTGGTGLFDELYKLFHILIDGMDENNLSPLKPWMGSIEDRIVKLEQEIHHQEITGHTKEVFHFEVSREVEQGSEPSVIELTQEHLNALNIESFETLANVFKVAESVAELEYGPNRGKMLLYAANDTDNLVYAMPTNGNQGYWFDYQGNVAIIGDGNDVSLTINFTNHTIEVANNASTEHVNTNIPSSIALVYNDGSVMHTVVFSFTTFLAYREPLQPLEEGDYYMYNVASDKWLNQGNEYGTRANLIDTPKQVTLTKEGDYYVINMHCFAAGTSSQGYLGENLYTDNPDKAMFTIEPIDYDGTFALRLGSNPIGYEEGNSRLQVTTEENANWKFFTYEDMVAKMSEASESNPFDATFLIKDNKFSPNNQEYSSWSGYNDWTNISRNKGDNGQRVAEYYSRDFSISQTIDNIPNGKYALTCLGLYREGSIANAEDKREASQEGLYAHVYANYSEEPIKSIFDGANTRGTEGKNSRFGYIPDTLDEASDYLAFSSEYYVSGLAYILVTNNTLTIGARKTTIVAQDWTAITNFKLLYLGA